MRGAGVAFALLLAACASSPQQTRFLMPDAPAQTGRVEAPVRIGLRSVTVAPYLEQGGLVLETDLHQVRSAQHHRWAEPLEDGLRRTLRGEISNALGYDVSANPADRTRWEYVVDVDVSRLHGSMAGNAILVASWRIAPPRGEALTHRFSETAALPRAGYPGLVDAEIALTKRLAAAIAESLVAAGAPGR